MTSIAEERRRRAAVGLSMYTREQWRAVFKLQVNGVWVNGYSVPRAVEEPATLLVAHIAVVDDPNDLIGTEDDVMRNIERIGISRFPNTGISYNAAAFDTGRLYEGQPMGRRGAHTANTRERSTCSQSGCPSRGDSLAAPSWNNNVNARACVAPQMVGDECTDAQVDAFARWGAGHKLAGMVTRDARWHGHRCFATKDCPGGNVWGRLDDIADLTADYVRDGIPGPTPQPPVEEPTVSSWDELVADPAQADFTGGKDTKSTRDELLRFARVDSWEARQGVERLEDTVATLVDQVAALAVKIGEPTPNP